MNRTILLSLLAFWCAANPCGAAAQEAAVDMLQAAGFNAETNAATNAVVEAAEEFAMEEAEGGPRRAWRGPVIAIGKNAELKADKRSEAVIAIGGSALAQGEVRESVVAILGDAETGPRVGEVVVAIGGDVRVNGEVDDVVVAILGSVTLGSNAIVRGDVVAIGGDVTMAEGADVRGLIQEISFNIPGFPHAKELSFLLRQTLLKLRPLAPQVRWSWIVAGVFIGVYFLIAIVFPGAAAACLRELSKRPATSFGIGLLAKIMMPIVLLILAATGVGLLVVPFVFAAMLFIALLGKVAMLQYLGGPISRAFGLAAPLGALVSLAFGSAIMVALYMVPVIGFLTFAVLGTWALGAGLAGVFSQIGRERPTRTPPPNAPQNPHSNPSAGEALAGGAPEAMAVSAVEAGTHPRAGFWERMGAGFLDMALLSIPLGLIGPAGLLLVLAYFAGMWTWKGTTIGGLVLQHKVVRHDGGSLSFMVALVRALAAAFSAFVLFLGFFWIGWNREKLAWHDMIAGTCVVRLPRAMPLVCI